MPLCVGHEVIGKAIKVGDKVSTVKVGDRVGVGMIAYYFIRSKYRFNNIFAPNRCSNWFVLTMQELQIGQRELLPPHGWYVLSGESFILEKDS